MDSSIKPNRRHYLSRTFWKFFLSYVILLTLVVSITAGASWYGTVKRVGRETQLKNLEYTRSVSSILNGELEKLITNSQQLRQVAWVHKFYSNSTAYDRYFDASRRMEILGEMSFYFGNSSIVTNMGILFPDRDICVSGDGWLSIADFLSILGVSSPELQKEAVKDIRASQSLQEAKRLESYLPTSNTLILAAPLENIPHSRAYICYLVSRQLLRETASRVMPDTMLSLSITGADGSEIISHKKSSSTPDRFVLMDYPASLLDWEYHYGYDPDASGIPAEEFISLTGLYLLFFLIGVSLSYLLAFITYRPLGRILSRVGGSRFPDRRISDYHIIEHSFDSLKEENARMRESAGQYARMMRTDVIKKLLMGYFDQGAMARDLAAYQIPFEQDFFYQAVLLSGSTASGGHLDPYEAVGLMERLHRQFETFKNCRHELVESLDNDVIAILAFPEDASAHRIDPAFVRELIGICTPVFLKRPIVSVGGVHQGLIGISVSYHFAVEQRFRLPVSWAFIFDDASSDRYYYPLEWENQLIVSLKAGNREAAFGILKEIRKENHQLKSADPKESPTAGVKLLSLLLETLLRVTSELSINDRLFMEDLDVFYTDESFDKKWDCLLSIALQIITLSERGREPSAGLGQTILQYVDSHFKESSLCLKSLGEEFNLSIQSISKLFKAAAGDTFYNYLSNKRMCYACELLRTTSDTMTIIAAKIGYDNEFSFKRAFVRFSGVRPKDYMLNYKGEA